MGDTGCLYLVASPIGNLGDFTDRGKKVLSDCDLIACEDTRVTKKLLSHLELSKPMISYREENEKKQSEFLAGEISKGQRIALLSDAGYLCITIVPVFVKHTNDCPESLVMRYSFKHGSVFKSLISKRKLSFILKWIFKSGRGL